MGIVPVGSYSFKLNLSEEKFVKSKPMSYSFSVLLVFRNAKIIFSVDANVSSAKLICKFSLEIVVRFNSSSSFGSNTKDPRSFWDVINSSCPDIFSFCSNGPKTIK